MPRPGVTIEDVIGAASKLREKGRPITTVLVRQTLERGSYNTISNHLRELGAKSRAKCAKTPVMPEKLRAKLAALASDTWQLIYKDLSGTTVMLEAQYDVRVRVLSEQLTKERKRLKQLEVDLCTAQVQLSACNLRATSLEHEMTLLRERLSVEQALLKRSERERESLIAHLASTSRKPPMSPKVNGAAQGITLQREDDDKKAGGTPRQH